MNTRPFFDKSDIHSVELNLLDGQVELILSSLELYSYNLEFMLNVEKTDDEAKSEKLAQLKYTYEQILSCLAEQVNGKIDDYENRKTTGNRMLGDNIIDIIPTNNRENFKVV